MKSTCAVFTLGALVLLAAVCGLAGPEEGKVSAAPKNSGDVVSLSVKGASPKTFSGDSFEMTVTLDIAGRWHLYAHEDTAFYGIDLELPEKHILQDIRVEYPAGENAEFFGEKVIVLHGKQPIHFKATVLDGVEPGTYEVPMSLAVQACDSKSCLAPAFLPVKLKVEVPVRF